MLLLPEERGNNETSGGDAKRVTMTNEKNDGNKPGKPNKLLSAEVPRDSKGRFLKGVGGNPSGRPKGSRNYIKEVQVAHEATLREFLADPKNRKGVENGIANIIRIMQEGEDSHAVAAGKLLLDKLMPKNASLDDAAGKGNSPIQINIVNPTTTPIDEVPGITIENPTQEDDDE